MFGKIAETIWKFTGTDKTNIYFIDAEKKIIIDVGNRTDRDLIKNLLGRVVEFDKIDVVIFTHLHYDHCGNFDLFPNATFYASQQEIDDFKSNANGTVLDEVVAEKLATIELKPLPEEFEGLKRIDTPGHTRGSMCLLYPKENALFTGDTMFGTKRHGRVDLPTSAPDEMRNSIMKLVELQYKLFCPGHDYETV